MCNPIFLSQYRVFWKLIFSQLRNWKCCLTVSDVFNMLKTNNQDVLAAISGHVCTFNLYKICTDSFCNTLNDFFCYNAFPTCGNKLLNKGNIVPLSQYFPQDRLKKCTKMLLSKARNTLTL